MKKWRFPLSLLLLSFVVLLTLSWVQKDPIRVFRSWDDLMAYQGKEAGMRSPTDLPELSNSTFTGSGRCEGCHGHDENQIANLAGKGLDVNPTDDWRATMMANAAKDPFWRAKVSHEVAVNPQHQVALEDKCTACHAPLGHFDAHYNGAESYSIEEMTNDILALDGVSCGACHQIDESFAGSAFSGNLEYQTDTIYGPYGATAEESPIFNQPMISFIGFDPIYGSHIKKSELCATCHTLITETVDLDGEFTGGSFVEQATYHEWLNSAYSDEQDGQECQACHFPEIEDPIIISSNYAFLDTRTPFGLHYMVGGNSFMLELLKNNVDTLGLTANEDQFSQTIQRTLTNLQQESAELSLEQLEMVDDTAYFAVTVSNLTGHKFPSGYPSRRAFITFVATNENGDTIFQSGVLQPDFEVMGQDDVFEPHYQVIKDPSEVQIYEMVMGDVNGDVTTVLERADHSIKDNRLVPLGFSTSHFAYDTTMMAGGVLTDEDFNHLNGAEGSGTDRLEYRVALPAGIEVLNVEASLMYQSLPPKWNDELFATDTPEIQFFESMYWETGPDAVLIDSDQSQTILVGVEEHALSHSVFPNPTSHAWVNISVQSRTRIQVFSTTGSLVWEDWVNPGNNVLEIPESRGTYFVVGTSGRQTWMEKIIKW